MPVRRQTPKKERPEQQALPLPPVPRTFQKGSGVSAAPEETAIYEAVDRLRKAGYQVHRSGADHKVNDKRLSTAQMIRLAASMPSTNDRPPAPAARDPQRHQRPLPSTKPREKATYQLELPWD